MSVVRNFKSAEHYISSTLKKEREIHSKDKGLHWVECIDSGKRKYKEKDSPVG